MSANCNFSFSNGRHESNGREEDSFLAREESSSLSLAIGGPFSGNLHLEGEGKIDDGKDGDLEINDCGSSVGTFTDFLPDQGENMDTVSPWGPLFFGSSHAYFCC